jgi:hypothetical protein
MALGVEQDGRRHRDVTHGRFFSCVKQRHTLTSNALPQALNVRRVLTPLFGVPLLCADRPKTLRIQPAILGWATEDLGSGIESRTPR